MVKTWRRVSATLTGRSSWRAASEASMTSACGPSLEPKAPPTKAASTWTRSTGIASVDAIARRVVVTICVPQYRSRITGTQRKGFMGLPAKGRSINIQAIDIHELMDGKIVRTWHSEDWMTGLHQLGLFERR